MGERSQNQVGVADVKDRIRASAHGDLCCHYLWWAESEGGI